MLWAQTPTVHFRGRRSEIRQRIRTAFLFCSLSAKADTGRLCPQRRNSFPRFFSNACKGTDAGTMSVTALCYRFGRNLPVARPPITLPCCACRLLNPICRSCPSAIIRWFSAGCHCADFDGDGDWPRNRYRIHAPKRPASAGRAVGRRRLGDDGRVGRGGNPAGNGGG